MKRIFARLIAVGLAGLAAASAQAMSIDLVLSDTDITVGESFTIDVVVVDAFDGVDPLYQEVLAFGFDVTNSDATVAGFAGASFLGSPFLDMSSVLSATDVAGVVFPGIKDDGFLLATLEFSASGPGTAVLGVLSDPGDLNEGLVYLDLGSFGPAYLGIAASVDVAVAAVPAPIPEPGTLVLLCTGLVGLAGVRRRRQA